MASIASEIKFNLGFKISNLYYPGIHVHVASNGHFGGPCPCSHAYLASKGLHELNETPTYRGDLSSIDLRGFAAGNNDTSLT